MGTYVCSWALLTKIHKIVTFIQIYNTFFFQVAFRPFNIDPKLLCHLGNNRIKASLPVYLDLYGFFPSFCGNDKLFFKYQINCRFKGNSFMMWQMWKTNLSIVKQILSLCGSPSDKERYLKVVIIHKECIIVRISNFVQVAETALWMIWMFD